MDNVFVGIGVVTAITIVAVWAVHRWKRAGDWRRQARILRRQREKITRKIEKLYGGGTRCPNCLRWPWDCDDDQKWKYTVTTLPCAMTCAGCGHTSYWIEGPGVMISVLPPPAPIDIG